MNTKSLTVGSILAALLASVCCLGPLLLAAVGVGAAAFAWFAALRPWLLTVSAVLLAWGFYLAYRKPAAGAAASTERGDQPVQPACCAVTPATRWTRRGLWLGAALVLLLGLFPLYGSWLVRATTGDHPHGARSGARANAPAVATLRVTDMDCPVCATIIQRKLSTVPGVWAAEVHYPEGTATVQYDPQRVKPEQLLQAIAATGYHAELATVSGREASPPASAATVSNPTGGSQ